MSKASSRRAILGALAVAPAAGLPAISVASDDPALVAIGEYMRLRAAADTAWKLAADAGDNFHSACDAIGVVTYKGEVIRSLGHLDIVGNPNWPMTDAELENAIDRLRKATAKLTEEAARPDQEYLVARTALEAYQPDFEKALLNSGVEAAENAASEAEEHVDAAQRMVFESEPTTPEGAAALIRLAADRIDFVGFSDGLLDDIFTDAIRKAVAILARENRT